jgi:hypothetical protein
MTPACKCQTGRYQTNKHSCRHQHRPRTNARSRTRFTSLLPPEHPPFLTKLEDSPPPAHSQHL